MKKLRKNNGITIIALVITIIILLILAGISIVQLTGSGLFAKATQSVKDSKKAKYYEEINLEIYNEHMERYAEHKTTAFISDLDNKIITKDWVSSTLKCDENFEGQKDDYTNTVLLIETKDGYEIIVDVDNHLPEAKIRDGYFQKVGDKCKVEYDANEGNGSVEPQEVRAGFYTVLQTNNFERTNYSFVGWCKDKDGNDELYAAGSKLRIDKSITLYAIWKKEFVSISFDANGGTGTMESINISKDKETQLSENSFLKDGYYFEKWNTKADGTGTDYTTTITINEDITLYAQWKKYLTVSFDANGGTGEMGTLIVKEGESVKLPESSFEKNGNKFFKWNTNANETGTAYKAGSSLTVNTNITIYATWRKIITYTDIVENPSLYYGKQINYSANNITNWKIFYANSNGIFIIAGDFVPNSKVPISKTNMSTIYTYNTGWESNVTVDYHSLWTSQKSLFKATGYTLNSNYKNSRCASQLLNVQNWDGFVNSSYSDYAIGAPTLEMWVDSWNTLYPNDKLYYNATNQYGYLLGTTSNPTTSGIERDIMKAKQGFKNKLFYPRPSSYPDSCYGYWIASAAGGVNSTTGAAEEKGIYRVWNYAEVKATNATISVNGLCIRPVVHLLKSTNIVEKDDGKYHFNE